MVESQFSRNCYAEGRINLQTPVQRTSDAITHHQLLTAALCRLAEPKSVIVGIFKPTCCLSTSQ